MSNVIKFPAMFSAPAGRVSTVSNEAEAKQCIKCALHTSYGELLGDGNFGSGIKAVLFEMNIPAIRDDVKKHIIAVANKYAKGVVITDIKFSSTDKSLDTVSVIIYYYLKSLKREQTTTITF